MNTAAAFADHWREAQGKTVRCARGDRVLMEDSSIAAVLRGTLALEASYADGSISWLAMLRPGNAARLPRFGDFLCDVAFVAATSGTEIGIVAKEVLRAMPRNVRARLVKDLLRTNDAVLRFAAARAQAAKPNRVAAVLLELADANGEILLSQEALSLLAGTTRETVNRILRTLNRAGMIRVANRTVTVLRRDVIAALFLATTRVGWHGRRRRRRDRLKAGGLSG